jgi:AraC-like DNA-binding protein
VLELIRVEVGSDTDAIRACLLHALDQLPAPPVAPLARVRDHGAEGGLAPWQTRRVRAYVEEHLATALSRSDLAHVAKLSTSQFCRAFKATFGQAPHAYVMSRRLRRAQEMMRTTDERLCQIAAACGLADQAHLCKLFRRFLDESPQSWRRRHLPSLSA